MIGARKDVGFEFRSDDNEKTQHFNMDGTKAIHVDVWVEAYDDKRFWLAHLPKTRNFKFFIKTPDEAVAPDGKKATGCNRLFRLEKDRVITLGRAQIFCLDSDDSFLKSLLANYSCAKSARDFVYFTKAYAIENIYLTPALIDQAFESVTGISVGSLKTPPSTLLEQLSVLVSDVIVPLYFYEAVLKSPRVVNAFRPKLSRALKSVKRVDCTKSLASCPEFKKVFDSLVKLNKNIRNFIVASGKSADYALYEKRVFSEGFNKDNAYLFVRGHCLYEGVIEAVLTVTDEVRDREVARVKSIYADYEDKVAAIHNQWPNLDQALKATYHASLPITPFFVDTLGCISTNYV